MSFMVYWYIFNVVTKIQPNFVIIDICSRLELNRHRIAPARRGVAFFTLSLLN